MSATVTYKGATLTTATNQTRTLDTAGTYLEDDITITDVTTIPTGTKNISITANGTTTEDVTSYASASITANVPNSYTASDEGKVVSSGALVSQTAHADVTPTTSDQTIDTTTNNSIKVKGDADLVAGNIKKDVEIFGVTGSYEGGGGGVDLTPAAVPISQNAIGGLFTAMQNNKWGVYELTVTSGTNPIEIDFGHTLKGIIAYPKEITLLSGLAYNDCCAAAIIFWDAPDENGEQAAIYSFERTKNNSRNDATLFYRISTASMINGVLSLTPTYPTNQQYHPFGFGKPYYFIYWWD